MNILKKFGFILSAFILFTGINSCQENAFVKTNTFTFSARNTSVDSKYSVTAISGIKISSTWEITIDNNGEIETITVTCNSDELPVEAGNIVEIQFTPTCKEMKEALFTMPDGSILKATTANPTIKWVVPEDFTPGMVIEGNSKYETKDAIYEEYGTITLIAIE